MPSNKKMTLLKETDPEEWRRIRNELNLRARTRNFRELTKEQREKKRLQSLQYYYEVVKPERKKIKNENPEEYEKYLAKKREYFHKVRKSDDPKDKERVNNYRKSNRKHYHNTKTLKEPNKDNRHSRYDSLLNLDVTEHFVKNLVKKTQAPLVVNESKKLVERALNAYNY